MSIINLIKTELNPEVISHLATQLGESESSVSKAIGVLIPTVLGSFSQNAQNSSILNSLTDIAPSNFSDNNSNNSIITNILSSIFGDKINNIITLISNYSGVNNTSANTLLGIVTGTTAKTVTQYAKNHNLDHAGITHLLTEQKGLVSSSLPAGLSLSDLGLEDVLKEDLVNAEKDTQTKTEIHKRAPKPSSQFSSHQDNDEESSFWRWLLPIILLGLASWFLWKQCEKKDETATIIHESASNNYSDSVTESKLKKTDKEIDLKGTKIKGFVGGMEDQLIAFLKTDGYKNAADDNALKAKWYNFDKINFAIGKADQLEEGSQIQIDNLVAILKAYPEAKIKIGGYTDKTGNEAENIKLSQARADYIKAALAKAGVGAQVLSAEGYGSTFATVPAEASAEERAADRKMAIRFAK